MLPDTAVHGAWWKFFQFKMDIKRCIFTTQKTQGLLKIIKIELT